MTDIAALGISVESSGVERGAASLDKLAAAAVKAEGAADGLANTSVRVGAAHERQAVHAKKASEALHAHGSALKLTGQQATQLSYQLNDVAVSLAGGQSPLTVLMQQGSQITPIFGGVRGTISALGTGIRSLLTPVVGATGAIVGLGAAAAYSFSRWSDEQKALDASLQGIGRRAGVTASALANLAASGAATGGLSISSGRDLAASYAGAGLSGGNIERAIGLTKTFARVTGQDLGDAGTNLAKALQDPTKGLETLNVALGFADEKTRVLIKSFQSQGDMVGAQRTLLAALANDLNTAADRTGALGKAWDYVKRVTSDTATGVGKSVDRIVYGLPDEERLAEETKKLIAIRAEIGQTVAQSAGRYGFTQSSVDAGAARQAVTIESRIDALERVIDRADRAAAGKMATQALNQNSGLASQSVYSILPELERRRALSDQIVLLEKAMNNPAMLDKMGMSAQQVSTALDGVRAAHAAILPLMEREAAAAALSLQAVNARSVAERADIAYRQAMAGQAAGNIDPAAKLKADTERAKVIAQAARDAEDRLRSANDNAVIAGLPSYQRSRAEIEQKYAWQNKMDAGSPDALAANAKAKQAEISALAQTSITGPMADANRSLESQNRLLAVNAATFGMSTDKVTAAKTAQEMFNRYIEAGIPITDRMRDAVLSYADGMGQAAKKAEELEEKQRAVVSGMDDLRSTSSSVFKSLMKGDTKGALRMLGDKALDNGANFLTEQLFGKQGKPGGGLLGDTIGSLFGASQGITVGSQTVTAGVVNLTGGVGGLGGIGGSTYTTTSLPPIGGNASAGGMADYLGRMFKIESGGNPNDRTGSNYGIAQFGYADMKQYGLSNPFDVGEATRASILEAQRNASALEPVLGRDATGADLYLAHQQGLAGSRALFQNPDIPAWQAIRPFYGSDAMAQKAITGNMGSVDQTSKQFSDMWAAKFNATKPIDLGGMSEATRALEQFKMTTTSATTDLGTFGGGLGKMGSALFNSVTGQGGGGGGLLGGLIGLLFGGLKFRDGGAFSRGNIIPFAAGGVVGGPTHFGMSGGRTGLMGEAGPEAIVPLGRDRSGRLGIRMAGPAPRREATPANTIVIGGHNITMHGEASPETREWLRGEMDRRDAISAKRFEQTLLVQNRRQAGMKG